MTSFGLPFQSKNKNEKDKYNNKIKIIYTKIWWALYRNSRRFLIALQRNCLKMGRKDVASNE